MNIKAINEGIKNFKKNDKKINDLARERYESCKCGYLPSKIIQATIPEDKAIPEISKKLCEECNCVLSFKLRQGIEKCKKWKR